MTVPLMPQSEQTAHQRMPCPLASPPSGDAIPIEIHPMGAPTAPTVADIQRMDENTARASRLAARKERHDEVGLQCLAPEEASD